MRLAAAMVFLASPLSAQDHLDCFQSGEAPPGAREPTENEWQTISGFSFGYHLIPLFFRRVCGFEDEQNRMVVDWIMEETGCSPQSWLYRQHSDLISIHVDEFSQMMTGQSAEAIASLEGYEEFCTDVGDLRFDLLGDDANDYSADEFHSAWGKALSGYENLGKPRAEVGAD